MRIGRAYHAQRNAGRTPNALLEAAHRVGCKVVSSKVKKAVGLGQARYCVSGAAPIAPAVLEFFAGLDLPIYEVYGQSEDTGPTSITRPGNTKIGTVGPPFPGVEVRFGDDGEILVRGPNVFLGYYKDPQQTAQTKTPDGWVHTGDAGFIDEDGYLYIRDRIKDMIITGGENVYPAEVENAILGCPGVADAAVIGVPDEKWGETVVAVVVPRAGQAAEPRDIIDQARKRIAGFKLPKRVEFIDVLPRNAGGKVLRRELRKPYWEGRARNVG